MGGEKKETKSELVLLCVALRCPAIVMLSIYALDQKPMDYWFGFPAPDSGDLVLDWAFQPFRFLPASHVLQSNCRKLSENDMDFLPMFFFISHIWFS